MPTPVKKLDELLKRSVTLGDCSFPALDGIVLRGSSAYWLAGAGLFLLVAAVILLNVWSGAERALVGCGDVEGYLWKLWWWKQLWHEACQQGWGSAIALFFSAGAAPHVGNILDLTVLAAPLQAVLGPVAFYNAEIILILMLNSLTCWWALTRIWGAGTYAWLGGLIYGFNGYFLSEIAAGRPRQAIGFCLPLFIWQFFNAYRDKSRGAWLYAALWLGLSWAFYAPYGAMLTGIGLVWWIWSRFDSQRALSHRLWGQRCALILALGALFYLPWGWSYLQAGWTGNTVATTGPAWSWRQSFPSLGELGESSLLTCAEENMLATKATGRDILHRHYAGMLLRQSLPLSALWNVRETLALPLLALVLAILPYGRRRNYPWLWLTILLGSLALSFGPYLLSNIADGQPQALLTWKWPYAWIYRWVPFASLVSPRCFLSVAYLALAILVQVRLRSLDEYRQGLAQFFMAAAGVAFMFQLVGSGLCPLVAGRVDTSPFACLLGDKPAVGLVEVPFTDASYVDFAQITHGCPSWGSAATRWYPQILREEATIAQTSGAARLALTPSRGDNTFIAHLLAGNRNSLKWGNFDDAHRRQLVKEGYKWLILHERSCNMLDPQKGEIIYFRFFAHLSEIMGRPYVNTFEPAYAGMPGRRPVDASNPAWYRVAVFDLEKANPVGHPATLNRIIEETIKK